MSDLIERLREEIAGWESAYPLTAFPEPDLKRAASVLKEAGLTLDAISASNMRHVVSRLAPSIHEAADTIERQAGAIEQAAVWFEEYAFQHGCRATQTADSGEQASRLDKAKRNKERAEYLRAALGGSDD